MLDGVNEFTIAELEQLFDSEFEQVPPPVEEKTDAQGADDDKKEQNVPTDDIDKTKAFAKRLKESTDKVRQEEREVIAKSLGYESYEKLVKENETKKLEEKGIDCVINQCILSEIASNASNVDLIVTSMRVDEEYNAPVLLGTAFLTGINEEEATEKLLEILS